MNYLEFLSKYRIRIIYKLNKFTNLIWKSIKIQIFEQWIVIIITICIFLIGFYFTYIEWEQRNTPLFLFKYTSDTESILVETGDNFLARSPTWWIPGIGTSTVGYTKTEMKLSDIVFSVANSIARDTRFDGTYSDLGTEDFLRCVVLNEFGLKDASNFDGFPIGVDIPYVRRGDNVVETSHFIVLVSNFDSSQVQLLTLPVSTSEMDVYLLSHGNDALEVILKNSVFDRNYPYAETNGSCRQLSEIFIERSLIPEY